MSKSKDSNVSKMVFDYLMDQNRPFNANDVSNNIQIECSKTALTKALDGLVSEGKVKEKSYGKQKVFYVNQNVFSYSKSEDVQTMESQIQELSNTLAALQKQIKNSEALLGDLGKSLTTEMAETELNAVKAEIAAMKEKLKSIESKNVNFDPNEMKILIEKKDMYAKQYQRRKRIANNIIDAILEGYPKSKKQLLEDLGVEVDTHPIT